MVELLLGRIRHRSLRSDRLAAAAAAGLPVFVLSTLSDDGCCETTAVPSSTEEPISCRQDDDSLDKDDDTPMKKKKKLHFFLATSLSRSLAALMLLGGLILIVLMVMAPILGRRVGPYIRAFARRWRVVHPDTFTHECKHNYLHNEAWGRLVAPYVDKHEVKDLVQSILRAAGREHLVKFVPTLAVYDPNNVSLFTLDVMQSLPRPYVIKPAHASGGIARVMNDTYECFKGCELDNETPFSPLSNGFGPAIKSMKHYLRHQYPEFGPPYPFIPPRVIIEEHLEMD